MNTKKSTPFVNSAALYVEPISNAVLNIENREITVEEEEAFNIEIEVNPYVTRGSIPSNNIMPRDMVMEWTNGEFLIKMPENLLNLTVNNVKVNNENVKITEYKIYEQNGTKFVKIKTQSNNVRNYTITIDTNIRVNSVTSLGSKEITLYSYNEAGGRYATTTKDIYDINDNLNKKETIGQYTTSVTYASIKILAMNQKATNFDNEGSIAIAPNKAYINKKQRKATIEMEIKNNYKNTIAEITLLGKIPTEGTNYAISNQSLGSDFSTTMSDTGIILSSQLKKYAKVYYSEQPNPTKDLTNLANGWTQTPADFSKVKSFLIELGDYFLAENESQTIKYEVNIPYGLEYNETSYSNFGVYFKYLTSGAESEEQSAESSKLGLTIAEKYDLELIKYEKGTDKLVPGATYAIFSEDGEIGASGITQDDGKLKLEGLFVGKTYIIKETASPRTYELNEEKVIFRVDEDEIGNKQMEIEGEIGGEGPVRHVLIGNDGNFQIGVQDELIASIKLKSTYRIGENSVPLNWTIKDNREGYTYDLYQKEEDGELILLEDYKNLTVRVANVKEATDKAKPEIQEIYLSASKVIIKAEDKGTTYTHMVKGKNEALEMDINSNTVNTTVISTIKGFAWKIDDNPNGEPENILNEIISGEPKVNTEYSILIEAENINQGKWLHIKPIDNANNVGETIHIELKTDIITLTSEYDKYTDENGYGPNYVPLAWENSNKVDEYSYDVLQKNANTETWEKVDSKGNETKTDIKTAIDTEAPQIRDIGITANKKENTFEIDIKGADIGTGYDQYIEGTNQEKLRICYSNTVHTIVKTGIKEFEYTISNSETEYGEFTDKVSAINKEEATITIPKSEKDQWVHIRPVDGAENAGEVIHILLDDARTISKEEKDSTATLYCVEALETIPAENNGTDSDATIVIRDFLKGKEYRETLKWPLDLQRLFEQYTEDGVALRNPYTTDGTSGKIDKTNSLGRYYITAQKPKVEAGVAYILSHYSDNITENSDSQNALYQLLGQTVEDIYKENNIYIGAKEYAKFREEIEKEGLVQTNSINNVEAAYSNNNELVIGPMKVEYIRSETQITDKETEEKETIRFSGIGVAEGTNITNKNGIHIYDQEGNEISPNTWTIVYNHIRNESASGYTMPLPGEEFYIKINKDESVNANVTHITKMKIEFYEMEAEATYNILEGEYNRIDWYATSNGNWCAGGDSCPHGRTIEHRIGNTYYVEAQKDIASIDSQKLWEVVLAKREYKTTSREITINEGEWVKVTLDIIGNIWNDDNETISNGLRDNDEAGIKGVEVILYEEGTNKEVARTVTDENGNYSFEKISTSSKYYITYIYDGQTYKTTKSFARGSKEDFKSENRENDYTDVSILDENETTRQELNDKFNTITSRLDKNENYESIAISVNGQETKLEYTESPRGQSSTLVTTNPDGTVKDEFKIKVSTKENDIYFPIQEPIIIDGKTYYTITDNHNINIGLSEREKIDASLRLDVYQTTFTIKGQTQSYLHNEKEIRKLNSNIIKNEITQTVNLADYNWRTDAYEDKGLSAEEVKKILGENSELEAYVEYIMVIRNSGENNIAYIEELADYYDKNLIYDFKEESSWIEIRNEDETESNYSGGNRNYVTWYRNSQYGDTNEYSANFNKIYADLGEYGIKKGQYAEIHIRFKVAKDANGNIILDGEEGKKNVAEINSYRSEQNGKTAGLIDIDSMPGDLDPRETMDYQDDEDRAPNYKLQLAYSNGNIGGSGSGEGGTQGGTNGDNGKVETDSNGNPIGYGNTIEGNVWEDIKTITIEEDNRKISNGIKETNAPENEPLVDHVKVELIEIIGDKEIIVDTVRTGTQTLLTAENKDNAQSTGAYRFSGLTSGKYKIRFTYGDEAHLKYQLETEGNLKYNGQDYQGVSSEKIISTDKTNNQLAQSYEDTEIMIVIDNSNSMAGDKMNKAKEEAKKLLTDLQNNLPGVKIGVVNFNETAKTIGKVGVNKNTLATRINNLTAGGETAIAKGIIEAKQGYNIGKNKLMIIITDGQETVDTEEAVIEQIESLQQQGIKLTTILTGNSANIFGTEATPRYGTVNKIENITTSTIYETMIEEITIEADRSLGKDIEADRRKQIEIYGIMDYEKGKELDIEGIPERTDRDQAITTLANNTTMRAETKIVEFPVNNVGADKVHEVNQALVKRPTAELKLVEEISSVKLTLSDGRVIIDTAKGLSKNVLGLDVDGLDTVSIYLDEELMQGATVEVAYRVMIENVGEVDRLSNYFEGESDATITTTANVVYAYINKSVVYRADGQPLDPETGEPLNWEPAQEGQDGLPAGSVGGTNITLRTDAFEKMELYPVGSKEVKNGEGISRTEVIPELVLSKLISPENDQTSSLTYECLMEIAVRGNEVGRRVLGAIPGDLGTKINSLEDGTHIELEAEEADSQKIIVTKPLGENRSGKTTLTALAIFTTIAAIALCLKNQQKLDDKNKNTQGK